MHNVKYIFDLGFYNKMPWSQLPRSRATLLVKPGTVCLQWDLTRDLSVSLRPPIDLRSNSERRSRFILLGQFGCCPGKIGAATHTMCWRSTCLCGAPAIITCLRTSRASDGNISRFEAKFKPGGLHTARTLAQGRDLATRRGGARRK